MPPVDRSRTMSVRKSAMSHTLNGRSQGHLDNGWEHSDQRSDDLYQALHQRKRAGDRWRNTCVLDHGGEMCVPWKRPSHFAAATLLVNVAVLSIVVCSAAAQEVVLQEALGTPLSWSRMASERPLRLAAANGIVDGVNQVVHEGHTYRITQEDTLDPIAKHIVASPPRNAIQSFKAEYKRASNGDRAVVRGVTLMCFLLEGQTSPDASPKFVYHSLPLLHTASANFTRDSGGHVGIGLADRKGESSWCLPLEDISKSKDTSEAIKRELDFSFYTNSSLINDFFPGQFPIFPGKLDFRSGQTVIGEDAKGARIISSIVYGKADEVVSIQDLLLAVDGLHLVNESTQAFQPELDVSQLLSDPASSIARKAERLSYAAVWDNGPSGNSASFHCRSRTDSTVPDDLRGTTDVLGGRYEKIIFGVDTAIGTPSTVGQILEGKMIGEDMDAVEVLDTGAISASNFSGDDFVLGSFSDTVQRPTARRSFLSVVLEIDATEGRVGVFHTQELRNASYVCKQETALARDDEQQRRIETAVANNEAIGENTRPETETVLNSFVALMAAVVAAITARNTIKRPLTYMSKRSPKLLSQAGVLWRGKARKGAAASRSKDNRPNGGTTVSFSRPGVPSSPKPSSTRAEQDPSRLRPSLDRAVTIVVLGLLMASFGAPNVVYLVNEVRLSRWEETSGFVNRVGAGTLEVFEEFRDSDAALEDSDSLEHFLELRLVEAVIVRRTAPENNIIWMAVFVFAYLVIVIGLLARRYWHLVRADRD